MTPLDPGSSNVVGSFARPLYDIAQGFDSPLDAEFRLRRALGLLRRIVPYDHCALLEASAAGAARLVVEPDAPETREALNRVLTRFLTVLTDEPRRAADWLPPDVAHLVPCAAHLAVPLVGLDRVLGVLFVSHQEADAYTDDHLRLLSVVASQIAAYLTACRLREQEAQIVSEHEAARAAAEAENRAKDEFLAMLAHELRNPPMAIRIAMQTIRGQSRARSHRAAGEGCRGAAGQAPGAPARRSVGRLPLDAGQDRAAQGDGHAPDDRRRGAHGDARPHRRSQACRVGVAAGRAARVRGRSHAYHPSRGQPARQRGEVHAARR